MIYNYLMKVCSKCNIAKDESDYFFKNKKLERLHAQCKQCYKTHRSTYYNAHYRKNRLSYQLRAKERRARVRIEFHDNIIAYLNDKACEICKESDIRVLEFDHLKPADKQFSISQAYRLGYKWEVVLKEIQKCRILCANCHKKHTARQFGWYKNRIDNLEAPTGVEPV